MHAWLSITNHLPSLRAGEIRDEFIVTGKYFLTRLSQLRNWDTYDYAI